jgi:hypothetical protein
MKGKTFLPPSGAADETPGHLHIIISEPDIDKNVMVVNITTFYGTGREDNSCIIEKGDHPFVIHKSYIAYHHAKEINSIKLLNDKIRRTLVFKEDVTTTLLKRIQDGAMKSRRLPLLFKKYFTYF